MVDVSGHIAMALLFASPAWLVWGSRGATAFTAFTLVTATLPDADLFLRAVLPVTHHGITHTVLFVAAVSAVGGPLAGRLLTERFNAHPWVRSTALTDGTVTAFATAGLFLGGLSHLFADLLSAPDIAAPLSPFWPVYPEPVIVDVLYYDSPYWNFGLLAVALALHLALFRWARTPFGTRYRLA
jgi:hypothetical protein